MSPKSGGRAQRRQRRNLLISVIVVLGDLPRLICGRLRREVVPRWAWTSPAVSRSSTRPREARVAVRPERDGQHLEPPGQRARRVRRAGADHGEEPDLGVHPRRHRMRSRCSTRSGRRRGMYFRPVLCLRLPAGRPEGRRRTKVQPTGHRDDPRLHVVEPADGGQPQRHSPTATCPRATRRTTCLPTPSTWPTRRPASASRTTRTARSCCRASAASGSANGGERYVLGPSQMTGHSIAQRTGDAEPDRPVGGRLHRWPGAARVRACGTRSPRQNFHQFLGIELDGQVYSAPIIQPDPAELHVLRGQGRDLRAA